MPNPTNVETIPIGVNVRALAASFCESRIIVTARIKIKDRGNDVQGAKLVPSVAGRRLPETIHLEVPMSGNYVRCRSASH